MLAAVLFALAAFREPAFHPGSGLVGDREGQVFVSDLSRGLLKIDAQKPWALSGVVLRDGTVYVLEHMNPNSLEHESWPPRVRKLGRDNVVSTLATLR